MVSYPLRAKLASCSSCRLSAPWREFIVFRFDEEQASAVTPYLNTGAPAPHRLPGKTGPSFSPGSWGHFFLDPYKFASLNVSEAMKMIVDGLVKLKNRKKLLEMREHRQRLRNDLKEKAGGALDISLSISMMDGDIFEIEEGLARLQ